MLRNIERISRLLWHNRSIPLFCRHSNLTTIWLGALWYLINHCFLGDYVAPNVRINSLRERQRRPRDSHLWFYDPDLRPVGYTLLSSSLVAGLATRSPKKQHFGERFQDTRTATNPW